MVSHILSPCCSAVLEVFRRVGIFKKIVKFHSSPIKNGTDICNVFCLLEWMEVDKQVRCPLYYVQYVSYIMQWTNMFINKCAPCNRLCNLITENTNINKMMEPDEWWFQIYVPEASHAATLSRSDTSVWKNKAFNYAVVVGHNVTSANWAKWSYTLLQLHSPSHQLWETVASEIRVSENAVTAHCDAL